MKSFEKTAGSRPLLVSFGVDESRYGLHVVKEAAREGNAVRRELPSF
jgi:hypothetical protein